MSTLLFVDEEYKAGRVENHPPKPRLDLAEASVIKTPEEWWREYRRYDLDRTVRLQELEEKRATQLPFLNRKEIDINERVIHGLPEWRMMQQGLRPEAQGHTIDGAKLLSLQGQVRRMAGQILQDKWEGLESSYLDGLLQPGKSSMVEAELVWQKVAALLMQEIHLYLTPSDMLMLLAMVRDSGQTTGNRYLEQIGILEMSCNAKEGYPNLQHQVDLHNLADLRTIRAKIIARITGLGYGEWKKQIYLPQLALAEELKLAERYAGTFPHPDRFGNLKEMVLLALLCQEMKNRINDLMGGTPVDQKKLQKWRNYLDKFGQADQLRARMRDFQALPDDVAPQSTWGRIERVFPGVKMNKSKYVEELQRGLNSSDKPVQKLCDILITIDSLMDCGRPQEATVLTTALEDLLEEYHQSHWNEDRKNRGLSLALDNVLMVARYKLRGAGNAYSNE